MDSPLPWAAERGYTDIVRLLLQKGVDQRYPAGHNHVTPLCLAAMQGHTDTVRVLLASAERGWRSVVNTADAMGRTPLYHAVYQGDIAIVRMLLRHGSTGITLKSRAGHSPMTIEKLHPIQRLAIGDMTMQWIWDLLLNTSKAMVDSPLEGAQPVPTPKKSTSFLLRSRRCSICRYLLLNMQSQCMIVAV
ncbi:ankyrin repeat-containing domain protein [Aspergillus venezuelensis]